LSGIGATVAAATASAAWAGAAVTAWAALSTAIDIGEFTLSVGVSNLTFVLEDITDEGGLGSSGEEQSNNKSIFHFYLTKYY